MVPTTAPTPPVASPALDVQAPVVAPQANTAVPPVQATPAATAPTNSTDNPATPKKAEGLSKVQDYASTLKQLDAAKEAGDDNMQRVGTLIGSVLSFWGGDYMGGVQGVQSVSKMGT